MASDALAEVVETLRAPRQCRRCRAQYDEMSSLGAHECRRHVGYLQTVQPEYGGRLNTFTCCGASPFGWHDAYRGPDETRGCVRCDHTDSAGQPDDIVIPVERAQVLFANRLANRAIEFNDTNTHIVIRREAANAR